MGLRQGGEERQDPQASEEAAVWLQRLRVEDSPRVRAEFSAWIRKGATNLEEFLFAQAIWKELDHRTVNQSSIFRHRSVARLRMRRNSLKSSGRLGWGDDGLQ
jgi:ferric-dicitrate binding protein FerR (iron transport regulator)